MTETDSSSNVSRIPTAMALSRVLRFGLGALIVASLIPTLLDASAAGLLRVAAAFLGLVILYTIIHVVVGRYFGWINRWVGAAIAVAPVGATLLMGPVPMVAGALFIGVSLLLMAALGDPGCEVMAIPSLLWSRRTHLACIVFSPLDWLEARVTGRLP